MSIRCAPGEYTSPPAKYAHVLFRNIPEMNRWSALLKCVDASHAGTDDESVNIVCTFVGLHGLEIHHVPHDRIVICDAVRAQNITGHAGTLERHPYVVTLGHRNMLGLSFVLIFQASDL